MAGTGSSMLYSLLLFFVILSLQEVYKGKLASSELFTILGGFTSSLLFLTLLTFIGSFQEASGAKTGWGAVFKENWRIKGRATISEIYDGRHLMTTLDSEDDAKIALTSPIRKVCHSMFRLFRYTPDYSPCRESTTMTKWVRLSGLHPAFFTRNYVVGIVNVFGKFLDLDVRTKACSSLKYARACVEVDVSKAISEEVSLILSDGRKFRQKIEVEGILSYCSYCKIHGHMLTECRKKRKVSGEVNLSAQSMNNVNSGKAAAHNMKMANTVQGDTGKEGLSMIVETAQATPEELVAGEQSMAVMVYKDINEGGSLVGHNQDAIVGHVARCGALDEAHPTTHMCP
ncbi:hypothetical protein QQ045_013349 [Rhodiola kirilowii]